MAKRVSCNATLIAKNKRPNNPGSTGNGYLTADTPITAMSDSVTWMRQSGSNTVIT
jgi:hypothetical protein